MSNKISSQRRESAAKRALAINRDEISWFVFQLMDWFSTYGRRFSWRREDYPLYKVVITEVLLQRTRAETVERFIEEFFKKYPDWRTIAHSNPDSLQKALKPFGLWQRRAITLQQLATEIENRSGVLPKDSEGLGSLTGLGPYIVNAILLYRDGSPEPLLDGGMARLLERFFGSRELADIRDDPFINIIAKRVLQETNAAPTSLNWAILDVAPTICRPSNPQCSICPLSQRCPSSSWRC